MAETSESKWIARIKVLVAVLALIVGSGWIEKTWDRRDELEQHHRELLVRYLCPIESSLKLTKNIKDELYNPTYRMNGWGILESYVRRVQIYGNDSLSVILMKQRIGTLVEKNKEMMDLIEGYEGHTVTQEFKTESAKFLDHALRWEDRWQVVPAVIEAKQQLPFALPFPRQFPDAVNKEIKIHKEYAPEIQCG